MKHYNIAILSPYTSKVAGHSPQLAILINCYCHLDQVGFGFSLLGKLFKRGHPSDYVIFNTLINALVNIGELEQALSLLNRIREQSYHPNLVTYGALIKGLCRRGKNASALSFLGIWNPAESVSLILSYAPQSLTAFVRKSYWMRPLTFFHI